MSDTALQNFNVGARNDNLENIAHVADTQLKIEGRTGGAGGFSRMLIVPEYFLMPAAVSFPETASMASTGGCKP
jgi:hypothetical protein